MRQSFGNNKNKRPAYGLNRNNSSFYCLRLNPTIEKHITDSINDTSHFILIYAFCLISSEGPSGRDSVPLSFPTQPWHWQKMVYFN